MSIVTTIMRHAADYRIRRHRMNTYRYLTSLPPEIQKDIGWGSALPDPDETPRQR